MKKVLIALVLAVLLVVLSGCGMKDPTRVTSAKVRYFDGSMDTVLLDSYEVGRTAVYLHTAEGRTVVIGPNNVIIIEESKYQYNAQE